MRIPHGLRAASGAPGGWDLSKAVFNGSPNPFFDVNAQESIPRGLFFKPDGTKMYVIGTNSDAVHEYSLPNAWDFAGASYVQNFSVATEEDTPYDVSFKDDGTKMYVLGRTGVDINEYSLSAAWDISTASYVQNFSVSTEESVPNGLFFKPDGTKVYVIGQNGDDVNEYSLSTAWDISTASYVQNFSVSAQDTAPQNVFFKPDGTRMYVTGNTGDDVNEYSLSTAWDISTASYVQNFSVATQDTTPQGLFFKSDGSRMYVIGATTDSVYQYTLSTAWDISTASLAFPTSNYLSVAAEDNQPEDVLFKPDGTRMYIVGNQGNDINEYSLSAAWDISSASYVQNFSVLAQDNSPTAAFFKPDGLNMYVVGSTNTSVYEYSLSSAWDISTASYVRTFSVSAQETAPTGLSFKDDGTKMYVTGSTGDDVNEYSLSTAWNISTASYVQNFSISAQDTFPEGMFFKPDGTKMYILGSAGDNVYEYDLSTAWDISTTSYSQNFSVARQANSPTGVFFKPTGTKMYVTGLDGDAVWSYDL